MSRIVVGLGGSSLGDAPNEQPQKVIEVAQAIAPLIEAGHQVVLCYGDAPQVGLINLAFEMAHLKDSSHPLMPLPECTSMDEGYMGFHLAQAIDNELIRAGLSKMPAITLLTQAIVDENDPAMQNPEKLIGEYYPKEQAEIFMAETGTTYKDMGEKGWRRVVPSPLPIGFLEEPVLKELIKTHDVIIAAGGGGIPVARDGDGWRGVAAVIDKDGAAAKLAEILDADCLLILAEAEQVTLNEGTASERDLARCNIAEAKKQLEAITQPGMRTKVEAALMFAESSPGRRSIIANVHRALDALNGKTGTVIE